MHKELCHYLQLLNCDNSTSAARIPRWRSTLQHSFLIIIDNTNIGTIADIHKAIKMARNNHAATITCRFGIIQNTAIYFQTGVPIVFHDQLNVISEHLRTIKLLVEQNNEKHKRYLDAIIAKIHDINLTKKRAKLTQKILEQQQDWSE